MSPIVLGLVVAGGVVAFTLVLFAALSPLVRRKRAALRHALVSEGIVRESGLCTGGLRYRDYRAPGFRAGSARSLVRRELILTRASLGILGGVALQTIPSAELHRYAVSNEKGVLLLVTDNPVGATGHMELRLRVPDPDGWVQTLRELGATSGASDG
jgi:hypothetical protein